MQKPPRDSRLLVLFPVLLCLLATVACQSTPEPAEPPARADVATWETPTPAGASQAEMEAIRQKNRDLAKSVDEIRRKMDEFKNREPAPVAPPAEPRPTPAAVPAEIDPEIDAARLAAAIRQAGIADLEVTASRTGETLVRLSGSLAFRAGSADLMRPARTRLSRLAEVLEKTYPGVRLRVEGHTDSDPIRKSKWESNQQLSAARAGAVSQFFVGTLGWPDAQISSRGFGADVPVATNSTREGKAQNRRIEIVLVP
jgi:chemotaxis protein MotB